MVGLLLARRRAHGGCRPPPPSACHAGTPEADRAELEEATYPYRFAPGRVYNLLADRYISSHGDVTGQAVANAVLAAITSSLR